MGLWGKGKGGTVEQANPNVTKHPIPRARFGERDSDFFKSRGYDKPVGAEYGGFWSTVTFSWIGPLLKKGTQKTLDEESATPFVPYRNDSAVLAGQFDAMYAKLEVGSSMRSSFFIIAHANGSTSM